MRAISHDPPAMEALNQTLFLWFNLGAQTAPGWVKLAQFLARTLIPYLLVATLAAVFVGRAPWRRAAWQALVAVAIAAIATHFLKQTFGWPRPFQMGLGTQWIPHSAGPGFPSSHAATIAAWAALAVTGTRLWAVRLLFLVVAIGIGWSRVAVGVHFPGDVAAGWVLGALCALLVAQIARWFLPVSRAGSGISQGLSAAPKNPSEP